VEQCQLFAAGQYTYRVFVTHMQELIHLVVAFYNGLLSEKCDGA
jgi:hypothetical protein